MSNLSNRSTAARVGAIAGAVAVIGLGVAWIGVRGVTPAHAAAPPASPALPQLPGADTIHDDPTIAPDPKQSADKNISLPADI